MIPEDLASYREVRRGQPVPVAGGECEFTRWGFREIFTTRAMDIVQPDTCAAGGLSRVQEDRRHGGGVRRPLRAARVGHRASRSRRRCSCSRCCRTRRCGARRVEPHPRVRPVGASVPAGGARRSRSSTTAASCAFRTVRASGSTSTARRSRGFGAGRLAGCCKASLNRALLPHSELYEGPVQIAEPGSIAYGLDGFRVRLDFPLRSKCGVARSQARFSTPSSPTKARVLSCPQFTAQGCAGIASTLIASTRISSVSCAFSAENSGVVLTV